MAITEHGTKLISKVEIGGVLYDIHDAGAVHSLADLGITKPILTFRGILDTVAELPATGNDTGDIYLVRENNGEYIWDGSKWELMDSHVVADHTHTVTHVTKNGTASASKLETAGSVIAGSDVVFTPGSHTADSFEQGKDEFTFNPGSYTAPSLTDTYVAPSFTAGEDVFTPNVPTKIDTSKFSGGSFTQGTDTFNAGSTTFEQGKDTFTPGDVTINYTKQELDFDAATFAQGEDEFTANVPTKIDVSKFNAGSASLTAGSYTKPTLSHTADSFTANTPTTIDTSKFNAGSASISAGSATLTGAQDPTWNATVDGETLKFSFNAGNHGSVSYTAPKLSYTAPSLGNGFYTKGSAASFTAGTCTLDGGSVSFPTLSYTAPSLGAGFYTAGSAASFTQGTDTFDAGSCTISDGGATANYTAPTFVQGTDKFSYTAPTFTQGKDSFTAAKLNTGFYTAGSAASFVQGTDTFNAGSHSITFNEGSYTAPSASFKQGTDKFTSGVYTAPTLTGGKATKVTLPTFAAVNNIWVGEKEETLTTSEAIEAAE